MGTTTTIQWCHHTYNPWRGCAHMSPGCDNCYAERQSKRNPRVLGTWGPNGTRAMAAEAYWRLALAWNRAAESAGERRRVFCGSLMDFFEDRDELETLRDRVLALALVTPWLDWLLLTKRPDDAAAYFERLNKRRCGYWHERVGYLWDVGAQWHPRAFDDAAWKAFCRRHGAPEQPGCLGDSSVTVWPPPNVWLGVTVENADYLWRIDELLKIPAAVRFVSYEPALGPVDFRRWLAGWNVCEQCEWIGEDDGDPKHGPAFVCPQCGSDTRAVPMDESIDWLIAGGESGPNARPVRPDWFRSARDQCQAAGVPFFFKQWGDAKPDELDVRAWEQAGRDFTTSKGGRLLDRRTWDETPD